jgi:uncharacterized protein
MVLKTAVEDRYHVLDALRGFALFGIVFFNVRVLSGWSFLSEDQRVALWGVTAQGYDLLIKVLFAGKFYTLFSLLFGIGFSVQLSRLEAGGRKSTVVYLRRLVILLLIGSIHMFLIWPGDILMSYALLGFLLLALHRLSDKSILSLAGITFSIPIFGYLMAWASDFAMDFGLYDYGRASLASHFPEFKGEVLPLLKSERWADFFAFNISLAWLRVGQLLDSWRFVKLIFVMLVGMWCGRAIIRGHLLDNDVILKRVAIIGLSVGLVVSYLSRDLGAAPIFSGPPDLLGFKRIVAYMFSVFPMGFAYGAIFVLIWNRSPKALEFLSPAGRMALTNYLMQSIICLTIFYGIGLNYAGDLGPVAIGSWACLIFLFQLAFSKLWLSLFKYGPLEWVWRCLTYGKFLRLVRD